MLELSHSTLTNIQWYQAQDADLTITINRADLEPIMMRKATFASQAAAGRASLQGNPQVLQELMAPTISISISRSCRGRKRSSRCRHPEPRRGLPAESRGPCHGEKPAHNDSPPSLVAFLRLTTLQLGRAV